MYSIVIVYCSAKVCFCFARLNVQLIKYSLKHEQPSVLDPVLGVFGTASKTKHFMSLLAK